MEERLGAAALAAIAERGTGATRAAFFDLDRTIIARSATLALAPSLRRAGILDTRAFVRSGYARLVHERGRLDHDSLVALRSAALEVTRGWEAGAVRQIAREAVQEILLPSLHSEVMERIEAHRTAGDDVWVVSTSTDEVVAPLCEALGIPDHIATTAGIDATGRYDGTLTFFAYGRAKATAIEQIAEVRGYDLPGSAAYSDSVTDVPMLEVVGQPVAVNPDDPLRATAEERGWEVLDVRNPLRTRTAATAVAVPAAIAALGIVAAVAWRGRGERLTGSRGGG